MISRSRFLVSWILSSRSLDLAALASALRAGLLNVVVELVDLVEILLVRVHPLVELPLGAVAGLVDAGFGVLGLVVGAENLVHVHGADFDLGVAGGWQSRAG